MVLNRVDKHALLSQAIGVAYHDMVDTFIMIDNSQIYIYWKDNKWTTARDICNSVLYGYDTLEELIKAIIEEDSYVKVVKDKLVYDASRYGRYDSMVYFQHYLSEVACALFKLKHNRPY